MKKLLITLMLSTAVALSATAIDDIAHNEGQRTLHLHREKGGNIGQTNDRSPAPQYIICHYSSESITLNFPSGVDCITISIGPEYSPLWSGIVTAEQPTAQLPSLTGEQLVNCQTDTDVLYSGYLTF